MLLCLQRPHRLAKVRDLPAGHAEVEQTQPCDRATHPARRDGVLQTLQADLLRGVEQKIVIAPVAQPKRVNPRQQRQHGARLKAQDDVKDDR